MGNKMSGFKQTIQWYDDNAQDYASKIENSPAIELIQRFINTVGTDSKILDAGCAGGRDCRIFKDRKLMPVGIDLSMSLIEVARKKNPDIEFHHGSFLDLPFEDLSFDGVWSHASLLHLETIEEVQIALKEFYRVLRPGGFLHVFVKQQTGKEKTTTAAHSFSGDFKRFFQFFTKQEMRKLIEEAGFKMIDIQDNYRTPDGRKNIKWVAVLGQKV